MAILQSKISEQSPSFIENKKAMDSHLQVVATEAKRIMQGGTEASRERHVKRGKLLPREIGRASCRERV